jgi:hypothetical protein
MSRRRSLREALDKSFVAVLNSDGVMVDADRSVGEAQEKTAFGSPTGTVIIDENVYTARSNDSDLDRDVVGNPVDVALKASRIAPVSPDVWAFDPTTTEGARRVREARSVLREKAQAVYEDVVAQLQDSIHFKEKRGGIARQFRADWLSKGVLGQNQKMGKVLGTEDVAYDSIGLSLLPHGASFRDPFATSTRQGPGGASFCAFSTQECRKTCLVNTGQRALESGAFARSYLFSQLVRENTGEFLINLLDRCLNAWERAAQGKQERGPAVEAFNRFIRLNVLSDLPWEAIAPGFLEWAGDLARYHAGVDDWVWEDGLAFYDYTKIPYRPGVENYYDITYSFTGKARDVAKGEWGPADHLADIFDGRPGVAPRAAVVFVQREVDLRKDTEAYYRRSPGKVLQREDEYHPWTFFDEPVWNGDKSDIRPLDPEDVRVVGLTYKVASYKVAPEEAGKKYSLVPVVPSKDLDKDLPFFLVRVMQPDPEAPPIVVPTQDLTLRKLTAPGLEIIE